MEKVYCWAITETEEGSRCGPPIYGVLSLDFNMSPLCKCAYWTISIKSFDLSRNFKYVATKSRSACIEF